jgi:hypothetical protein
MADEVSIASLAVSIISAGVAVFSAITAWKAKQHTSKASILAQRLEAITHIRNAIHDTVLDGNITTKTAESIRQAAHLSEVVFDKSITHTVERAFAISDRIKHIPSERQDDQYDKSKDELDRLLGDILLLMKKETSLGD